MFFFKISKRYFISNMQFRGSVALWDLTLRCLIRYWIRPQVHYITDVNPALVQVIIAMAWCWHPHGWHMWNTVIRLSCIFNTVAAGGLGISHDGIAFDYRNIHNLSENGFTHPDWMTNICSMVNDPAIGPDNGLSPVRRKLLTEPMLVYSWMCFC